MTITLITGGNRGLGFEAARQLLAKGHDVVIGARDAEKGGAAAKELGARFVQLDVTDDASVNAAARQLGALDVLINNAGVANAFVPPMELEPDEFERVFATNVFGVVRVTRAMLPLLQASKHPVIVNVGSGLGSFARVHELARVEATVLAPAYCASKAALAMLTVQWAKALPQMRVNVVDPGYTATGLNGFSGPQTVQEGVEAMVRAACLPPDGATGTLTDRRGVLGW